MRKSALLLLTLLGLGIMLWAQQPAGFTGARTVVFSEHTKVGVQVLPAGEYKVTHTMEGSEHIMVFKGKKQEYRVKCNMEPLNERAAATRFWYNTDASGQRVLEAFEMRGDNFRHVIAE